MTLGSIQPLTEMSTRTSFGGRGGRRGKGGRCVGLTTLPPLYADCLEIWEPEPPGTLGACPGLYRYCFTPVPDIQRERCTSSTSSFCDRSIRPI
jgi:hypothetical protein